MLTDTTGSDSGRHTAKRSTLKENTYNDVRQWPGPEWLHRRELAADVLQELDNVDPTRSRREASETLGTTEVVLSSLYVYKEDLEYHFPDNYDKAMMALNTLSDIKGIEDRIPIRASHQHHYLFFDATINWERIRAKRRYRQAGPCSSGVHIHISGVYIENA